VTTAAIQHAPEAVDSATMLQVVAGGDCSRLTPAQRIAYYNSRCDAAGLDPRAQPFAFVRLNGKEVLYALKAASDQLAAKHGVRLEIVSQITDDGIRVVTVRAIAKDGRQTDEIGAVPVKGLQGEALCNALMKAVTKAKRRAILSLTGLGMLDETEIDSIPSAAPVETPRPVVEVVNHEPEPEAKPAPAKKDTPKPPHVIAAWEMAKRIYGDAAKAREAFKAAVTTVCGASRADNSASMTEEEALDVESILSEGAPQSNPTPSDIEY
jgi:hypothetical protein